MTGANHYQPRATSRSIPEDVIKQVMAAWESGMIMKEIALKLGLGYETVRSVLRRGPKRQASNVTTDEIKQMCELYATGMSVLQIAQKLGFVQATVERHVYGKGIPRPVSEKQKRDGSEKSAEHRAFNEQCRKWQDPDGRTLIGGMYGRFH